MSLLAHMDHLEEKHAQLEEMIAGESARPSPDFQKITTWKKQKLMLKEEMARLKQLAKRLKKTG